MSPDRAGPGLLVAVVGPSGAGKDTLIRLALDGLDGHTRIELARRVVTRAADESSEDHDSMDDSAFAAAERDGAFCLTWRAHGLAYGLPSTVEERLRLGVVVLANLSRRALADAGRRFGRIAIVEVTARPELLMRRIAARGRETPEEIAARLARLAPLAVPPETLGFLRIDNSRDPADGARRLRRRLLALDRLVVREGSRRHG